jgi:galactonate dehydratase
VADGFTAVKIYPAGVFAAGPAAQDGADVSGRRFWAAAEARLAAVRRAVGPDVAVLTDWAWQVLPADAPRLAALAHAYDLYWVEEPFAGSDPERLRELSARLGTGRVAAGEQLHGRRAFARLLHPRAVDVVMPDVKWIGGISEARTVCAAAASHDVEASPHNMSGPVATAASAQVAAVSPNVTLLEYCYGNTPWRAELVSGTEDVRDGMLHLGDRPGLGLEWDAAAAHDHLPST